MLQVLLATNVTITVRIIRTDKIARKRAAAKMVLPAIRQMANAFVLMAGREQSAQTERALKISMARIVI